MSWGGARAHQCLRQALHPQRLRQGRPSAAATLRLFFDTTGNIGEVAPHGELFCRPPGIFWRSRIECGELFLRAAARGQRRFALIGGGDLAEIAGLAAREQPVEIAGVVSSYSASEELGAAVLAFGAVDAVMVTSLENPHEAFSAAVVAFGPERVYVPALLGIEPAIPAPAGER